MPLDLPSIDSASPEALIPDKAAARVAAGPGFWADWLSELSREGLLEALLAEDVIARALREAPGRHRYHSALDAKMTLICVLVACLFPEKGYDQVLAKAFGLPGLRFRPGEVPSGSALSQARERLGELAAPGLRARRRARRRGSRSHGAVEGPGGHRAGRHHDGTGP